MCSRANDRDRLQIFRLTCFALPFWVATSSCADAPDGEEASVEVVRDWVELQDGSFFEKHRVWEDSDYFMASRCWPSGGAFDCIVISYDTGQNLPSATAERQQRDRLGDFEHFNTGYDCYARERRIFGIVYQETIRDDSGETLLENEKVERPPYQAGWTKEFATNFMVQNGVTRSDSFFRCQGLAELMSAGSAATLGTTAVSRENLLFDEPA